MSADCKLDAGGIEMLAKADAIARDVIAPAAAETDKLGRFPSATIDAMGDAGLLGLVSAKDIGGQGQGLRAAIAVVQRFARECPSTAMITTMHYCGTAAIEAFGSESLRRSIAQDGKLTTLAISEVGSRSHFWVAVSQADRVNGQIKLNATKQLITAAGHADIYVWSSRPVAGDGLSSLWAVPSDTPGLSIPTPFDGLGLRGNSSAPITARDVFIPEENHLGEDGKGFDIMMTVVMPYFSLLSCAVSLGMMEGACERAVQHVTGSKFSYDNSTIADIPQVRGHIANARLKIDMLHGFLADALNAIEQQRDDATMRVLQAKVAGSETSLQVLDLLMRVCGGAAYRKDVAIERYFRDSRAATVMAPVADALYDFIGKLTCGMPLFD